MAPVLAALWIAVRTTSSGLGLFRQRRVGKDGQTFTLYKFRSMYVGAEARKRELAHHNEHDGVVFKIRDDPRVTPLGKWLRRYSLDELPQLFNVLLGQMSLVGPRPPLPDEVTEYGDDVRRRLVVKPGLTGLWQISGPLRSVVGGIRAAGSALRGELVAGHGSLHPVEDGIRGATCFGSLLTHSTSRCRFVAAASRLFARRGGSMPVSSQRTYADVRSEWSTA